MRESKEEFSSVYGGGGNIMGRGEVRRDIRGDVRDAINEERKIRFSSRPSSQRRFFVHAGNVSE